VLTLGLFFDASPAVSSAKAVQSVPQESVIEPLMRGLLRQLRIRRVQVLRQADRGLTGALAKLLCNRRSRLAGFFDGGNQLALPGSISDIG